MVTRTCCRPRKSTRRGPRRRTALSKIAAERYVEYWANVTGGAGVCLRLANVYGPRQNPLGEAGVVAIFCRRLLLGEPCVINGDGRQTRDFVYVEDVSSAVARAATAPGTVGIVNIGTGCETSVNEVYRQLAAALPTGRAPQHGPPKPGEQRRSVLSNARARSLLSWAPATSLEMGLRQTLADVARSLGHEATRTLTAG